MFTGSSYLQYEGLSKTVLLSTEVEIVFKTSSGSGVLLYNGLSADRTGDFISISLSDGFVEFSFDLGTGPAMLR